MTGGVEHSYNKTKVPDTRRKGMGPGFKGLKLSRNKKEYSQPADMTKNINQEGQSNVRLVSHDTEKASDTDLRSRDLISLDNRPRTPPASPKSVNALQAMLMSMNTDDIKEVFDGLPQEKRSAIMDAINSDNVSVASSRSIGSLWSTASSNSRQSLRDSASVIAGGDILGSGADGIVKSYRNITIKGHKVAVKSANISEKNDNISSEFIIKLAMFKALGGDTENIQLNPLIPVVAPYDLFLSDNLAFMSMPTMDGDRGPEMLPFAEMDKPQNKDAFENAKKKLTDIGFLLYDIEDNQGNVFTKENNVYLGDCGRCKVKQGTEAAEYIEQVITKEKEKIENIVSLENLRKVVYEE